MTTPVASGQDFLKRMRMHGLESKFRDLMRESWHGGTARGGFDAVDYQLWTQPPTFDEWYARTFGADQQ